MVVDNNNFKEVVKEFGHEETQAHKIVIVGGGNIGYSLSKAVEDSEHKIATNLIEYDKVRNRSKITILYNEFDLYYSLPMNNKLLHPEPDNTKNDILDNQFSLFDVQNYEQ